jgi:hypothetical protein
VIITSGQVGARTKKVAMPKNITLLEGIRSAEDLARGLKDADIVRPQP